MRVVSVKILIDFPKFNFPSYIELAKYHKVLWLVGYLNNLDNVSCISSDTHILKVINPGKKIRRMLNGVIDEFAFVFNILKHLKRECSDVIIVHYHRFAFVYPLFLDSDKLVLRLYTASVSKAKTVRVFWNIWQRIICRFYRFFFVATENDITAFKLPRKSKVFIIHAPLEPISTQDKDFNKCKMLYIGTLHNRRLEDTIVGLKEYIDRNPSHKIESYDIIGKGKQEDNQRVIDAISDSKLSHIVRYHGFLPDDKVPSFFDKCNLGVAYVPITEYYDRVLVTKLYEYFLSGIPSLATNTHENRKIVNSDNGVLIEDSASGFAKGLEILMDCFDKFNSQQIRNTVEQYSTEYNVKHVLVPAIESIVNE